jgi:hypothetical protein
LSAGLRLETSGNVTQAATGAGIQTSWMEMLNVGGDVLLNGAGNRVSNMSGKFGSLNYVHSDTSALTVYDLEFARSSTIQTPGVMTPTSTYEKSGTADATLTLRAGTLSLGENLTTGLLPTATGLLNVTLQADSISTDNAYPAKFGGNGTLRIQPLTSGRSIGLLGGTGLLSLDANLLGSIQTGFGNIVIGDDNAGLVTLGAAWTVPANASLSLIGSGFVNASGSATPLVTTNGRWLIYTDTSGNNTLAGMAAGFKRYNCTYGSGCLTAGTTLPTTGNGLLYSVAPVLTVAPNVSAITYGQVAPTVAAGYTGFIDGDSVATAGIGGAASFALASYTPSSSGLRPAGSYGITTGLGSLASVLGYQFQTQNGSFAVNKANATVTANSAMLTYNGQMQSVSGFTVSGLVNGESAGVLSGVTAGASGINAASYTAIASGTDSNYNLSFVPGSLVIDKRSLSLSLASVSKVYDGNTTVAVLPEPTFGNAVTADLSNLGLTIGSGSYDTRHVGTGKSVSYSDLVLSGSAAGNYRLSGGTTASGLGTITQLDRVAWIGGSTGVWSTAANWAGGALPDNNNVANIDIAASSLVRITDSVPLNLGNMGIYVTGTGGSLELDITGGLTTGIGAINVAAGNVRLITHSPMSIGSGGVSATQGVSLMATTPEGASTIQISGPITSTSGPVAVDAYGSVVQNANIAGTAVSMNSSSGNITMSATASTAASAGDIFYAAPAGAMTLARLNAGTGAIELDAGGSIDAVAGFSGANLVGSLATINAGGNLQLKTQVNKLDIDVEGIFSVADSLTGTVFTNVVTVPPHNEMVNQAAVATDQALSSVKVSDTSGKAPETALLASVGADSGAGRGAIPIREGTTIGGVAGTFGASSGESGSQGASQPHESSPSQGDSRENHVESEENGPAAAKRSGETKKEKKEKDEESKAEAPADRKEKAATKKVAQCT